MPILPSEVDGVNPGSGQSDVTATRLRALCEVLLTTRAKMLGVSKSFSHRFSGLPGDLKSSLVSALGEIVAHLDSFDIQPGDTRLTGRARLGVDAGMDAHFPGKVMVRSDGTYGGTMATESTRHAETRMQGRTVVNDLPAPKKSERMGHPALLGTGEPRRRRERVRESEPPPAAQSKTAEPKSVESSGQSQSGGTPAYGNVWRNVMERTAHQLDRSRMDRDEAEELARICLSQLGIEAPRPAGGFAKREAAVKWLEKQGYVRMEGVWKPTPAGLEASGLFGLARLQWDP